MDSLQNKVAVVTGSAQGIGKEIAKSLIRLGVIVYGLDINDQKNQEVANECLPLGKYINVHCDISSPKEINEVFNSIISVENCIDILVNNAAIFTTTSILKDSYSTVLENYEQNMNINTRGTLLCIKKVVDGMAKKGHGEIININTNHVKRKLFSVSKNEHSYDASKYAQLSLNESIARELNEVGIRVNAICPAATRTPMLNNFFKPEDLPLTAEIIGKATHYASLLEPEEVANAVIGMITWPENGVFGKEYLLMYSEDCESLAKRPVEVLAIK